MRKKNKKFKAFFSPEVFVHHKQRKIFKFLLQRLSFGTALISFVNFKTGLKGFIPIFPILSFLTVLIFLFTNISFIIKLNIIISLILMINFIIYFEITEFVKKFKDRLVTLAIINLANFMHIVGSLIVFFGFRKIFERKIYVNSRNNK